MQANHTVAHGGEHPLHLVIAPFADGQTHFGRRNNLKHCGPGEIFFIMQLNAFGELFSRVIRDWRLKRNQIGFFTVVARRRNSVRPLTIIGHQHQTGRINIQTPRRMQFVRDWLFKEIEYRWVIGIVRRTDVALRLIEHKIA
ncbi:hypothetical protein D3C78_1148080 [compost metagenome]